MTDHSEGPDAGTEPARIDAGLDEDAHPATRERVGRMPARRVVLLVVLTLLTALVLDSRAVVRAGEGTPDGLTRTLVLAVAGPVDSAARAVGLGVPRERLDALLGTEHKTARDGDGLANAARRVSLPPAAPSPSAQPAPATSASPPASPTPSPTPTWPHPSVERPLRLLVTGDSLADYVGDQIANLTASAGLVKVTTIARNGTGLTNPDFFDWVVNARQEMTKRRPDAVVVVLGGNDGWHLEYDGKPRAANTDGWEAAYARRVAAVLAILSEDGTRPVYWSTPPAARSAKWRAIFARQARAAARAAASVAGTTYVDLFGPSLVKGRYSDYLPYRGTRLLARQHDGIHYTYDGAVIPAETILQAMRADLGPLR